MNKESIYNLVIKKLTDGIENGSFELNHRLPSERDLAECLSVSRGSLREALRVMEEFGLVETRKDGRYLIRTSVKEREMLSVSSQAELEDLLEVRSLLEDRIVELACLRATEEDIQTIKEYLDKGMFEYAVVTKDAALNYDNLFHIAVANAAHNAVFVQIYEDELAVLQQLRRNSLSSSGNRKKIIEEHQLIYEAIRDRDPIMARLAVQLHLRGIKNRIELQKKKIK